MRLFFFYREAPTRWDYSSFIEKHHGGSREVLRESADIGVPTALLSAYRRAPLPWQSGILTLGVDVHCGLPPSSFNIQMLGLNVTIPRTVPSVPSVTALPVPSPMEEKYAVLDSLNPVSSGFQITMISLKVEEYFLRGKVLLGPETSDRMLLTLVWSLV